jgi:hypothetical protein
MRVRVPLIALAAAMLGLGLPGCLFDATTTTNDEEVIPEYPADLSAPESLVVQLQVAYELREAERFNELLAPEFYFGLHQFDALYAPADHWGRGQEVLATGALFEGTDFGSSGVFVERIRLRLTTAPAGPATLEEFPGEDLRMIRVMDTALDVDLSSDTTLRVNGDRQLFWFRRGRAVGDEDPARWYLLRWEDQANPARKPTLTDGPVPVAHFSWGWIRLTAGNFGTRGDQG